MESKLIEHSTANNRNPLSIDNADNLPVAIYTCDSLGYIVAYNKAAVKLWGRTPVIGQELWCGAWKIFKPEGDPLPLENCPMARTIKEGIAIEGGQIVVEQPGGKRIKVKPYPEPLFDGEGKLIGAINTLIDVTQLTDSEEKQYILAAIVDTSDDTIISKTLGGIITSWNNSAQRMFGYTVDEVIGKHISIIIPHDRLNEEEYIISQIVAGNKVDHFETIRIAKDGTLIPISLSISPVLNSRGQIVGASKIARDISQQKMAQEAAKLYTAQLEAISADNARLYHEVKALNEKKDEFIGLASHELKTPLTSVMGYLQILNRLKNEDNSQKFIGKAIQQVKKLSALISDLLDVSKIEAGKLQLTREKFDIRNTIEDVIELIQNSNHNYQISLNTTIDTLSIHGDAQRIEQVLINLLTNAIKYSPSGKTVEVFLTSSNEKVKIGVKDYGIGIPPDKLNIIFSRFYRVDELNSTISGLGIGLYISKEIIDRHSGKLWVESELGKGSTFWITLPFNHKKTVSPGIQSYETTTLPAYNDQN